MMNNQKNDYIKKSDRRNYPIRRRLKSSIVHGPNGSMSTFKQFYQNGGRDYEGYCLWLQTLSNRSTKNETMQKEQTENHCQLPSIQSESTNEIVQIHSPINFVRRSSFSFDSSHAINNAFESQIRSLYDYSSHLIPQSILHWSVHDVGLFIEQHFPEKDISEKFIEQKIDGRTLPLLTEDHLTRIFKMKLGPALHLLALISALPK